MTHKAHPKSLRIISNADWLSRWFAKKNTSALLQEDFNIRQFLKQNLKEAAIEKIEIERTPGQAKVLIYTARPGMVIGRGGESIEELRKKLIKYALKNSLIKDLKIEVVEVKDPWLSAQLAAEWAARQLEKRVNHRRVMKQVLAKVMSKKEVQGAKIEISGRIEGAEIARRTWIKEGKLPKQTFRAIIDYGFDEARCTYGTLGVKVWLYKGERKDEL